MPDRPSNRQRRRHLKNLRKIQKIKHSQVSQFRHSAAASSKKNPLVALGLVVSAAVLLLFLGSMFFQYKDSLQLASAKSKSGEIPSVEPSTLELRVLNGCGVSGASRRMTQHLRDLHFDVVITENAQHFNYVNTLVINHTNRPEVGRAVAEALGCSHLSMQADDLVLTDVTVILGKDWEKFLGNGQEEGKQKSRAEALKEKLAKIKKFLGL